MFLRHSLTAVEKAWLDALPNGTIVVPYMTKDGRWTIATVAEVVSGVGIPSLTPPSPPENVLAVPAATSVEITWAYTGEGTPEGFNVYRDGTLVKPVYGSAERSWTDTSVVPSTTYTYSVSAFNITTRFESAVIPAPTITTLADDTPSAPAQPSNATAVETSPGSVFLTWQYNSAYPVSAFEVRRDGSYLGTVAGSQRSFSDGNVPAGARAYTVAGFNTGYGLGVFSDPANVTVTQGSSGTPSTPTGVTLTAVSSTSLRLDWAYADNYHAGFVVELFLPDGTVEDFTAADGIGKASRSFTLTGLTPVTAYGARVSSVSVSGGGNVGLYPSAVATATTLSGSAVSPLDWVGLDFVMNGVVGVSMVGTNTALATTGGVPGATITFAKVTGPTFLTVNSSTGAWGGTPDAPLQDAVVRVSATDGVTTIFWTFALTVTAASLTVAKSPSLADGATIAVTGGTAATTRTWTPSGGLGAPYVITGSGTLPAGYTPTITGTSLTLSGTPTATVAGDFPYEVSVTSGAQTFRETYLVRYTPASSVGNRAPVISISGPLEQTITEGVAVSSANVISATDADGDSVTLKLESASQKDVELPISFSSPTYTVDGKGVTFNRSTGVLAATYTAGVSADGPITYKFSADDGVADAMVAASTIPTVVTSGVSAIPQAVGVVVQNAVGSVTYALRNPTDTGAGTAPAFLGTFNTSTGLFPGSVGTVSGGAATYSFMLKATDSSSPTPQVTKTLITVTVNASTAVSDFETRVYDTLRATNFQKVFIAGVQDTSRTITSLGSSGQFGSSHKGKLTGELVGTQQFSEGAIEWGDDPSGYQPKIAKLRLKPTFGRGAGTMQFRVDGSLGANTTGGAIIPRVYAMFAFRATREIFAYRDPTTGGEMKLAYFGTGFDDGEAIVMLNRFTGFFTLNGDTEGNNSIPNIMGVNRNQLEPHDIPKPHPWGNDTGSGRIYQAAGQWAKGAPWPQTVVGSPPAGITAADKQAFYEYYGYLTGSSVGLETDLGSLGVNGVNAAGVNTPWLDERVHKINGVDVGWPCSYVRQNTPCVVIGEVNYIQLFFERSADGNGYFYGWHMIPGGQWRLIGSAPVRWGNSASALDSHRLFNVMNFDSSRDPDPNRPDAVIPIHEVVTSLVPIRGPGGVTPPFNHG